MLRMISIPLISAIEILTLTLPAFCGEDTPGSKPSFSGVIWATYWHAISGSPTNVGNGTANSFDIKRVWLSASGMLDEFWSWKIIFESSGTPPLTAFAKAAYINWAPKGSLKHDITFGLQPTLFFATTDQFWGYRIIAITARELLGSTVVSNFMGMGTGAIADFGVKYSIRPHETFSVSVMMSNGAGHRAIESNMHKKLGFTVGVIPIPDSIIEFYLEDERGYIQVDQAGKTERKSHKGLGLLTGYRTERFVLGVDYFQKTFPDKSIFDPDGTMHDADSEVISLFGSIKVKEKFRLLGRFDYYVPITDEELIWDNFGKSGESLLLFGADCSYRPPNANFILTYQLKSFDAKYYNGNSWVVRNPYGLIALDVAIKY